MDQPIDLGGIAALLAVALTIITTFINRATDKTKRKVDVLGELTTLANAATSKNVELMNQVIALEEQLRQVKNDIGQIINLHIEWHLGIQKLCQQIRRHKEEPVWEPDPDVLNKLKETYNGGKHDKE